MKKTVLMMAFAAMTMFASAQGLSSWENVAFACQYPSDFEADEPENEGFFKDIFSAETEDEKRKMKISFNDNTISSAQAFKEHVETIYKIYSNSEDWKASAPVIKGMTALMRCELVKEKDINGEMVKIVTYNFSSVAAKSKRIFLGEISFPLSEESKYKPLLDQIVSSIKEK